MFAKIIHACKLIALKNAHASASIWQAKLTFIHNCRYRQLQLWISTIQIVDIDNFNPRIDMNPNQIISLFMAGKTNIFGANPAPALVATI